MMAVSTMGVPAIVGSTTPVRVNVVPARANSYPEEAFDRLGDEIFKVSPGLGLLVYNKGLQTLAVGAILVFIMYQIQRRL